MPECEGSCCRVDVCVKGGCVSPALEFTIPKGRSTLANDTRTSVTLEAGVISEEGLEEIANELRRHVNAVMTWFGPEARAWWALASDLHQIGNEWQTSEGNYTKRLSKLAYTRHRVKVPPQVLSAVGNIATTHSSGDTFRIEVTRDLNQPAEKFAHRDSCWWTSEYYHSRCAAKTNGIFALRTFRLRSVLGRAWVAPVRLVGPRSFGPTFDTMTPDAFVVFNGYKHLDGTRPARIMAHLTGWSYRRIDFDADLLYVNNEAGYLVAPKEVADEHSDVYFDLDRHSDLYEQERTAVAS